MTFLEKYCLDNQCSESDFWDAQETYDGFCPDDVASIDGGCPFDREFTCEECWGRVIQNDSI